MLHRTAVSESAQHAQYERSVIASLKQPVEMSSSATGWAERYGE